MKKYYYLLIPLVSILIMMSSACDESSKPTPPPPDMTLELYVLGGVPEVLIDSNCSIGGYVRNARQEAESGHIVDFSIEPDNIPITPSATTDVNNANGFNRSVVFNSSTPDTVMVTGVVGNGVTFDLEVIVKEPANEN